MLIFVQLLQRMFPGQMPQIRRDIHNIVVPLDFTDPKDVQSVIETLQTFVQRSIPCRFAVVPTVSSPEAEKQAKVLYYLYENYGLQVMLSYLVVVSDSWSHYECILLTHLDDGRYQNSCAL